MGLNKLRRDYEAFFLGELQLNSLNSLELETDAALVGEELTTLHHLVF